MPWKETSIMSSRNEFVVLAHAPGANIRQLCRRFGISSRTAYKWLTRYADAGAAGLPDRSRRPHHSPRRTPPAVEAQGRAVRNAHPTWGGRNVHRIGPIVGTDAVQAAEKVQAVGAKDAAIRVQLVPGRRAA